MVGIEQGLKCLDDKPYVSHYLYEDIILDFPLSAVWKQALDIGAWMSAHRLEHLSGNPGEVGFFERVHPQDLPAETGNARYHLYGIAAVVPHKLIALQVLPEAGGSYGDPRSWSSFDTLLFTDFGDRTQVAMLLIDVHPGTGDAGLEQRQQEKLSALRALLQEYFENLRKLVEESMSTND